MKPASSRLGNRGQAGLVGQGLCTSRVHQGRPSSSPLSSPRARSELMAPRPASCLLFPRFPGEEGKSKASARWVLQLFGKIPRFRGEIVPGARDRSGLGGPKGQPKKSALPKPACGGSEKPHTQREHHPRVLEKCWKAGEDSIGLELNNAAAANKAGRYFQAQTRFPESMKKSSAAGHVRGEEAPRVSWGRTGCSRQRCRHQKPPVHHL